MNHENLVKRIPYLSEKIQNFTDLYVCQYGMENCSPKHCFGPAVRGYYLIHYVISGKGHFYVGKNTYHLSAGDGFLICPDIVTYYEADAQEPWTYAWVGFNGQQAGELLKQAGLSMETPVFSYTKDNALRDCVSKMIDTENLKVEVNARLLSLLYDFLSTLIEAFGENSYVNNEEGLKKLYLRKAIEYIEMNYPRKLSIDELSRYIGVGRTYLFSLFKKNLDVSPQEFLMNFRMDKACLLMENSALTIGEISRSVGYDDPLLFSKMFKKVKGQAPSSYRKGLTDQ